LADVFDEYGYKVTEPTLINAASWGVPQERKRLILLGARDDAPLMDCPVEPADRNSSEGSASPSVWDAIGDLPDLDDFEELLSGDEVTLTQRELARMRKRMSPYARVLHGLDDDAADFGWRRRWEPRVLTSSCRTTHRTDVVARFKRTEPGRAEPTSRLIRLHPDNPSTTLRAGTHYERGAFNAPRPLHPALPRVISVREAARLHSFPDWFRLHWTKWHGFRQIGNSVPPLMGRAVGAEVIRALGRTPSRPHGEIELGDPALLTMENRAAAAHFDADLTRIPRNELRIRRPRHNAAKGRLGAVA
jgi:DNA (cytosine-5)-methyltransferase 1